VNLGFFLCVNFVEETVIGGVQRIPYPQDGEKIVVTNSLTILFGWQVSFHNTILKLG